MLEKFAFKIRGIYSTAITQLLIRNGHLIADPSNTEKKYFSYYITEEIPDCTIYDNKDKTGLIVRGEEEALNTFEKIIIKEFDPFVSKPIINQYSIVKAEVIGKPENGLVKLKIGDITGYLRSEVEIPEGHPLMLSTRNPYYPFQTSKLILTPSLKIFGKYLDIITNPENMQYNAEQERILNLLSLSVRDLPFKCKIHLKHWKEINEHDLVQDFVKTKTKLVNIIKQFRKVKPGTILYSGEARANYLFLDSEKEKFDNIRQEIRPTLVNHHQYRSLGLGLLVDLAENMKTNLQISDDVLIKEIEELLKEKVQEYTKIEIQHVRPTGVVITLGPFTIEEIRENKLILKRISSGDGIYDGLEVPKEKGDIMITEVPLGSEWIKHSYYSPNGELKGEYININTPVKIGFTEQRPFLRYIDLIIDVIKLPGKQPFFVDEEDLKKVAQTGIISQQNYETILKTANEVKKRFTDNTSTAN